MRGALAGEGRAFPAVLLTIEASAANRPKGASTRRSLYDGVDLNAEDDAGGGPPAPLRPRPGADNPLVCSNF